MFALIGLSALTVFLYLRPQEFIPAMQRLPLLYLFFGAALGGILLDLKLRLIKPVPSRSLLVAFSFYAWIIVVIAVKVAAADKVASIKEITITFVPYLLMCQGIQSFRALRAMAGVLLACGMFLTFVGIHQAHAPTGCLMIESFVARLGVPDGRPCETADQCRGVEAEPGAQYDCQRIGLFGTTALNERVRYRGTLQDPNELAAVVSASLALLFGLVSGRRSGGSILLAIIGTLLVLQCVIYTQSRGGILAFASVLGVYYVRRFGFKYILIGVLAMLPVISLGGRESSSTQASTDGRYEAWAAGLEMFRSDPVFGIGPGAFTSYHHLTAHNSHVLAVAELGFLGFFLWVAVIYITLKPPIMVLRDFANHPRAGPARSWAVAVLAMGSPYLLQMFFLSLTYHGIVWIYFGFAGGFYSAVKAHAPGWEVKFGIADLAIIACICLAFLTALVPFLLLKGFM